MSDELQIAIEKVKKLKENKNNIQHEINKICLDYLGTERLHPGNPIRQLQNPTPTSEEQYLFQAYNSV